MSALRRLVRDERVRKYGTAVIAVAVLVVLWGGYIQGWRWTGFPANNQLWDWLNLLLLPVVFGTLPIWIQHAHHISRARRTAYLIASAGFAVFVLVGYLVPLRWTGFPGNTLWSWFEPSCCWRRWSACERGPRPAVPSAFTRRASSPPWPSGGSSPWSAATSCGGAGRAIRETPSGTGCSCCSSRWCSRRFSCGPAGLGVGTCRRAGQGGSRGGEGVARGVLAHHGQPGPSPRCGPPQPTPVPSAPCRPARWVPPAGWACGPTRRRRGERVLSAFGGQGAA